MARTFVAAGLLVAVLLVCGVSVQATYPNYDFFLGVFQDIRKDVSKCNPTSIATSCVSVRATSYGGWAVAYANSSAAATTASANGCAKAINKAFLDLKGTCKGLDSKIVISQMARACARASIKLRTDSYVSVKSDRNAVAYAKACGFSSASATKMAEAIAGAVVNGLGTMEGYKCTGSAETNAVANVSAIAKVLASGMAASWASAYSKYRGKAAAQTYALFAADVATYAKATSKALVYACGTCKSKKECSLCKGLEEGDNVVTDALGEASADVAAGATALALAFSDALAATCNGRAAARTTIKATLEAIADVCIQLTADAYSWAQAKDNSMSCAFSSTNGTASGLSEAYGSIVATAYAEATKGKDNECEASAGSELDLYSAFSKLEARHVISAVSQACVNGTAYGAVKSHQAVPHLVKHLIALKADAVVEKLTNYAMHNCECKGKGFCCTSCPEQKPELCPMVSS